MGELNRAAVNTIRDVFNGPYYMHSWGLGMQSNLEIAAKILRDITRNKLYYSDLYPYQGVEYYKEMNNNRYFTPRISSSYTNYGDFESNEIGK